MTRQLLTLALRLPAGTAPDAARTLALMAGRLGCSAIHLDAAEGHSLEELAAAAAPALVVVDAGGEAPGMVTVNDPAVVARERAKLDAGDATRPLLVAVPISIGRTMSEAIARADLEPRFADRHPRDVGIFGTFEQAQEQVLALARAGADGLLLDVPLARDVADVLAQVRALVLGATPHLIDAHAGRSSAPAPRTVFYGG
jgi:hypothetical protein